MPNSNFNKPDRIYKYTSFNTAEIILTTLALRFSRPSDFNDPFDCDVNLLEFDSSNGVSESILDEMKQMQEKYGSYPKYQKFLKEKGGIEKLYVGSQIAKVKSSRVCCFSLSNDIVLMWSHYADKHKGVCLEFDNTIMSRFPDLNEDIDLAEGIVSYNAHEKINYLREEKIIGFSKLFLSKSESWSHEQEYRLVTLRNMSENQKFTPNFLKAIYFGVNSTEDEIDMLYKLCCIKGLHVGFFVAEKKHLEIYFNKIKLIDK